MQRKISIVLILTLILSVFSGFVYAEEEHPARIVGREIKNNPLVKKALDLDYDTKIKLATAALLLKNEQKTIVSGLFNAVKKSENLSTRLENNDVTEEIVNIVLNEIKTEIGKIEKSSIKELLEGDITWNSEIKEGNETTTVGDKVKVIYDKLLGDSGIEEVIEINNKLNEKLKSGKTKTGFILKLVAELVDYGRLTKTITNSDTTYSFSISNKDDLLKNVNIKIEEYFEGVDALDTDVISAIKQLERKIDGVFKDVVKKSNGERYFNSNEKSTIFEAIKFINPDSAYVDDKRTSVTPPDGKEPKDDGPEVEIKDGKAEVVVGKDAVEIETGTEGQSIVKIKEDRVAEAIDALVETIKKDPKLAPQLTVKLDDVKTLAAEISIPAGLVDKLIKNKIELVIESKALIYEVPSKALESTLKDAPKNSYIEFKSSIVEKREIEELIKDEFIKKVAKAIDLQLVLKDSKGKVVKTIDKFDTKIKIAIEIDITDGNPDLLGVYYINEEIGKLEFVGGKIKGSKIIMTTDHYSKFAIIEYDKSFADIEDHWSKDYVKSMVAKHVIDGFEDNTYRPEDRVTRAQFAKLLVEVLELDTIAYKDDFKDVGSDHWAKDYIATAKQQGIIEGYEDKTFKPEQPINRSEMAAMITNALGLDKGSGLVELNKFKDVQEIPAWAVEYVASVVREGLLIGSNGMLNPLGNTTRAEAATIIYRVYNK